MGEINQGKGVVATQEEPNVRERIKPEPGSSRRASAPYHERRREAFSEARLVGYSQSELRPRVVR